MTRAPGVIALIPARGGSKRLPRKNIRPFAAQPLLVRSIALARQTPGIDRCVVSTDDAEIADVALQYGAEVIERPAALADDSATTAAVACHALGELRASGNLPSMLVTLQPNCPLRTVDLVRRALALFALHRPDTVMTVSPTQQKRGVIRNGVFEPGYRPGIRSQDMEPAFVENGLVYVSDPASVLATGDLIGRVIRPLVCDGLFAHGDIDTELEFAIAEFLFLRYRAQFPEDAPRAVAALP